MAEYYTVS